MGCYGWDKKSYVLYFHCGMQHKCITNKCFVVAFTSGIHSLYCWRKHQDQKILSDMITVDSRELEAPRDQASSSTKRMVQDKRSARCSNSSKIKAIV